MIVPSRPSVTVVNQSMASMEMAIAVEQPCLLFDLSQFSNVELLCWSAVKMRAIIEV